MANKLGRDIEPGEIVVINKEYLDDQFQDIKYRMVMCMGGFGMMSSTSGNAVFVEFLDNNEKCRMEGYMIDRNETRLLEFFFMLVEMFKNE